MRGHYGGSATSQIVKEIEAALANPKSYSGAAGQIQPLDIREAYFEQLDKQLDLFVLRAYKGRVYPDAMGGAAAGWLGDYARTRALGLDFIELHGTPTPLFNGVNPEPLPQNLGELIDLLKGESGLTFGVVTDDDADRVGAGGKFFNSHQILDEATRRV